MEPLRIGVLGAARIADEAIVGPARAGGHRIVAVAARDPRRAESFAARAGAERVHADYDAVLSDPEVEVVYNPLPNSLHVPWNIAAIEAGKHVLTEKPSAGNRAGAQAVREAVVARGVRFAEGFHYLHHPLTRRLQGLLASGELGELRRIEVDMFMPAPEASDPRWNLQLAGGSLMDLGCYGLHAARHLPVHVPGLGQEPRVVSARAGEHPEHPGVDAWFDAHLQLGGDAEATVRSRMGGQQWRFAIRVVGSSGEAEALNFVKPQQDDRLLVHVGANQRVENLGRRSSYEYQLEAFAGAVRNGAALPTDANDAVATMELIDACYHAAGMATRGDQLGSS